MSSDREERKRECLRKATDLLARRPHFRRQLEEKLGRRGFESADVEAACDRLEQLGYLDDRECARAFARDRTRRMGYGPRRLRMELAKRGAAESIVDATVEETFASGEMPTLRRVAREWLRRHEWRRDRLARHLERKGFTTGAILEALGELEQAGDRADESETH